MRKIQYADDVQYTPGMFQIRLRIDRLQVRAVVCE